MRVYVPIDRAGLIGLAGSGVIGSGGARYIAEVGAEDLESAEYDALSEAAEAAAGRLDGPGRRIVVVAELADAEGAFTRQDVVAVYADTEDVDPADADLPELGWFATQELADLVE